MEQNGKRRRRLLGRKKNNRFWDSLLSVVIFSIGLGEKTHCGHFYKVPFHFSQIYYALSFFTSMCMVLKRYEVLEIGNWTVKM